MAQHVEVRLENSALAPNEASGDLSFDPGLRNGAEAITSSSHSSKYVTADGSAALGSLILGSLNLRGLNPSIRSNPRC